MCIASYSSQFWMTPPVQERYQSTGVNSAEGHQPDQGLDHMLCYGKGTAFEKRRLRGDPTAALRYPEEIIERMELAFHTGALWKDEKQQT